MVSLVCLICVVGKMTHKLIETALLEQLVGALEVAQDQVDEVGRKGDWDALQEALTAARAAIAGAEPTGCLWSKDPDFEMGDTYDSACGEKWSFIDGGPTENRVRFCQGCGKPVKPPKESK